MSGDAEKGREIEHTMKIATDVLDFAKRTGRIPEQLTEVYPDGFRSGIFRDYWGGTVEFVPDAYGFKLQAYGTRQKGVGVKPRVEAYFNVKGPDGKCLDRWEFYPRRK